MLKTKRGTLAATTVCLIVAAPAPAVAAERSVTAQAATTTIERKVEKLRKQVRQLKLQLGGLASASGATGPAGGDLTGSYPNPLIATGAVGSAQLAGNAIFHDTNVFQSAFGNHSDKIGPGAIGRTELADGEVRADELGAINEYVASGLASSNSFLEKTVDCPAGERLISGGAHWDAVFGNSSYMEISESYRLDEDTWKVAGKNNSNHTAHLRAYAYCLG